MRRSTVSFPGNLQGSKSTMRADERLDLTGVIDPYCFLLCKSALASLEPGAVLEIEISDPQTLEDLMVILDRSGEKILWTVQHETHTRLWVQKKLSDPPAWPNNPED